MSATQKPGYIGSFDTLRGFAVLFVLLVHGSYGVIIGGWIGVDLFFVLSGYLITSLLLKEYELWETISLTKFYVRRALRLFPPLILCVLLAIALWPFTNFDRPGSDAAVASAGALFYFNNFLRIDVSGNLSHLWSLSVEEHFYLFWPLLVLGFLLKVSYRRKVRFLVALLVVLSVFKIAVFHLLENRSWGLFQMDSYRFTLCRIDSVLMGGLLAFVLAEEKSGWLISKARRHATPFVLAALGVFLVLLFTLDEKNPYNKNGGFVLTNLLCTLTVLVAAANPNHPLLSNKLLQWVGKRSYGIYLYHMPVFMAMEGLRQQGNLANMVCVSLLRLAVSVALAALSYEYIEQPLLKLKKRYEVRKLVQA